MSTELLIKKYGQNVFLQDEGFWEYERLVGLPVNRDPVVGTRLNWSSIIPCYELPCFRENDDWLTVADALLHSAFSQHAQVTMTINASMPLVSLSTAFFLQHLDDFMFYSNYTSLMWTTDRTCVLECSRHKALLYSTFSIK